MPIIAIFGPDGSGKSTLAKFFRSYLLSHGIYAHISWFRSSHLPASFLAKFLSQFVAFEGCGNLCYGITLPLKLRLP